MASRVESSVDSVDLDEKVQRLVNDISRHEQALPELLRFGERAVESLDRYLSGPPQSVPHARSFAARVLGLIGGDRAADALRRTLHRHDLSRLDPVSAQSEFVVKNAAVEQLMQLGRDDFAIDYLRAFRTNRLPAAAKAIVRFQIEAAIPDLVLAMEDDVIGTRAADALRELGRPAVPALVKALFEPHTNVESCEESRISRCRRVRAALTLGDIPDRDSLWPLRLLMQDPHPLIGAAAALAVYRLNPHEVSPKQAQLLVQGSLSSEWLIRDRCQEAMRTIGAACVPAAAAIVGYLLVPDLYGVPVAVSDSQQQAIVSFILETAECQDALIEQCLDHWDAAALICGVRAVQHRSAAGNVALLFRHPNEDVRKAVAQSLGRLGGTYSGKVLVAMIDDPSRHVRAAACDALLLLGSSAVGVIRGKLARRHRPLLRSLILTIRLRCLLCHIQPLARGLPRPIRMVIPMIDDTHSLAHFRIEVQRLSSEVVAALAARLATRFFCFAADLEHARHIIRRLYRFAGIEEPHLDGLPKIASPKYFDLFIRGNYMIERCGLVLANLHKHANQRDSNDDRAEITWQLLRAIAAALDFGPHEGIDLIHHAVGDDVSRAAQIERETRCLHRPPLNPSEDGPFGMLWPGSAPRWWRAKSTPSSPR